MKRKSRIYRVGALLLVLCFISTVMISGTFARYTSEYSGQDTALVAKWSLTAKGGQDDNLVSFEDEDNTMDLFAHAYETNIKQKDGDDYIIAPGVDGEFFLEVTNNSDVAAKVEFEFEVDEGSAGVPMEYSLDPNFAASTIRTKANFSELKNDLKAAFATLGVEGTASKPVYWRWVFEGGDDAADTALGVASASAAAEEGGARTSYTLKITATATQLEPTP